MNRYLAPCILPYSKCVYEKEATRRRPTAFCNDITTGPGNSDAKCFKVTWRKQMIKRSLDSGVVLLSLEEKDLENTSLEEFLVTRGYLIPEEEEE